MREEYVVNKRIVDRSSTGPIWTWTFEPDGAGTTLTQAYEYSPRIPLVDKALANIMWNADDPVGCAVQNDAPLVVVLVTERSAAHVTAPSTAPWSSRSRIVFSQTDEPKAGKLPLYIDVNATDRDQDDELERLLAAGARRVDIGQTGAEPCHVLADPEGNEFCLLGRRVPKAWLINRPTPAHQARAVVFCRLSAVPVASDRSADTC